MSRQVTIEIRPKRYRCPYCEDHPTMMQRLEWYEPNNPHTKAFEQWIRRALINSTVADRFHVAKAYRGGTDERRKQALRLPPLAVALERLRWGVGRDDDNVFPTGCARTAEVQGITPQAPWPIEYPHLAALHGEKPGDGQTGMTLTVMGLSVIQDP